MYFTIKNIGHMIPKKARNNRIKCWVVISILLYFLQHTYYLDLLFLNKNNKCFLKELCPAGNKRANGQVSLIFQSLMKALSLKHR